jgi:hypothetical protein
MYLIPVPELLEKNTLREEVLWNFFRLPDQKRLTLSQNPHFYANLPTSSDANWRGLGISPTEGNWHDHLAKPIPVLTNSPSRVFLELGKTPRAFDNVWILNKKILVFKGQYFPFCVFFSLITSFKA